MRGQPLAPRGMQHEPLPPSSRHPPPYGALWVCALRQASVQAEQNKILISGTIGRVAQQGVVLAAVLMHHQPSWGQPYPVRLVELAPIVVTKTPRLYSSLAVAGLGCWAGGT